MSQLQQKKTPKNKLFAMGLKFLGLKTFYFFIAYSRFKLAQDLFDLQALGQWTGQKM